MSRVRALVLLLGALVPTVMPTNAAAGSFSDVLVFVSNATFSPAEQWEGGTGSFSMAATTCEAVSNADFGSTAVEVGACTLTASGSFRSTYCGVGQVSGTVTIGGVDGYTGPFDAIVVGAITLVQARLTETGAEAGGIDNVLAVGSPSGTASGQAPTTGTDDSGYPSLAGDCISQSTFATVAVAVED